MTGPWPRLFMRLAMAAAATIAAGLAHPIAGLVVGVAALLWLASRYDNYTGSLVLVTGMVLGAVAILVALLMVIVAMASA